MAFVLENEREVIGWGRDETLVTSPIKSATDVYDISYDLVKFLLINSIHSLRICAR